MQRDKRGRFIKKANLGTTLTQDKEGSEIIIGGKKYRIKTGSSGAYSAYTTNAAS
jgi:hypothetical protein